MSTRVNINAQAMHWEPYSLGQYGPVCGIHKRTVHWSSVCIEELKHDVTCDHCLAWIAERQLPATRGDVDERVVNMTFNNGTSDDKIEAAIERGIKAGLEKVRDDFFCSDAVKLYLLRHMKAAVSSVLTEPATKTALKNLAEGGVTNALQRSDVRQNLIGIHKIADDELEAEYASSEEKVAADEEWENDIRRILTEVLQEAAPGQTGVGVGTTVVNVNELNVDNLRTVLREVMDEFDEDTADEYAENETGIMQRALASIVASEQFEDLFKKLVKEAVDEKAREDNRRSLDWQVAWLDSIFSQPSFPTNRNRQ